MASCNRGPFVSTGRDPVRYRCPTETAPDPAKEIGTHLRAACSPGPAEGGDRSGNTALPCIPTAENCSLYKTARKHGAI